MHRKNIHSARKPQLYTGERTQGHKENKTLKVQQEITKGGRNTNNKPDVRDKETQRARGVKTEEGTNRNTEYS